jgi:hypothetical protein
MEKLNVLDRITLMGILPVEGNYMTFKILAALKTELSFSEAEIQKYHIREVEGRILWDMSVDKEIEIGEIARGLIKESLKKLDELGKVNEHNISLYEKFMN